MESPIDQLITLFNAKSMDLPDGLFDRKTQFLLNGATFESLLSATPNDPLVLMLARGPAGYRFAAKALQHAVPDARLERGDGGLWLSGHLRGIAEPINTVVRYSLTLAAAGWVEVAEATIDQPILDKIKDARLRT
jgi:hypothetical protein